MSIKILAFDLDYTLLNDKKLIPPENFEAQRGSYRLRREFPAYTVRPANNAPLPSPLRDTLLKLGFRLG